MRLMLITILSILSFLAAPCGTFAQVKEQDNQRSAIANYRIQQGDKLSVKFFNNPDLNEPSLIVRPDGFISLQIINEIRAEGLTTSELRARLEKAFDETLLEPIISVIVIDFIAPHVYIAGQVTKPGRYDLREAKTLMQAVFLAGGFTRDANRNMVIHARPNGTGDWNIQSAKVMDVLRQKGSQKDILLQDGDYVFIPDSKISQFNKAVETIRGVLPRFF